MRRDDIENEKRPVARLPTDRVVITGYTLGDPYAPPPDPIEDGKRTDDPFLRHMFELGQEWR